MSKLKWDQAGERRFETGTDRGVLYLPDNTGAYLQGVAWNGLTGVTETPAGADSNKQYADNIVYANIRSAETLGGTIEAFTYPDEFEECDGSRSPKVGVSIGQQGRRTFGLSYRTLIGNDLQGTDAGYKLHLVYGATVSPSERAYATVNDSPEPMKFSWAFDTTGVEVAGFKRTALLTIDSTKVDPAELASLEDLLYGTDGATPKTAQLPLPDDVLALFTDVPTP